MFHQWFHTLYRQRNRDPLLVTCYRQQLHILSGQKENILIPYVKCPLDMVCWYSMYDANMRCLQN